MKIIHLSMECYPAAKAGGLGDVVGALPKYQNRLGFEASVCMPKYNTAWILKQKTEHVFQGVFVQYGEHRPFAIERVLNHDLGFELFLINLPGLFDRESIYIDQRTGRGFSDEIERNVGFQKAALTWIGQMEEMPAILHCHDHHTALVPFFINEAFDFEHMRSIATVLTIHNGMYQGGMPWSKLGVLPAFHPERGGLLEWEQHINSLACGIKTAWKVTTVSSGYMRELAMDARGLEMLFRMEYKKCSGLLNGIDNELWDPSTDSYLDNRLEGDLMEYKQANKASVEREYGLVPGKPLFTFIGRFAYEKGADLLPEIIADALFSGLDANFFILGSGDLTIQHQIGQLKTKFPERFNVEFAYNEPLSHRLYAGSDFLLMPSRVEPCGLNQLYALRYGAIPVVHAVGGLKDTVPDLRSGEGTGFAFAKLDANQIRSALFAAEELFRHSANFVAVLEKNRLIDHSWETATEQYIELYKEMLPNYSTEHVKS